MSSAIGIQRIIDLLMYNQLYAPDYPSEDRTDLVRQERLINQQIAVVIEAEAKREDVGDWLRLGSQSVTLAFESYRTGDPQKGCKNIESAIEYLRKASSKKPFKATFITKDDGTTKPVP